MSPAWRAAPAGKSELPPMPAEAGAIAKGYGDLIRWCSARSERDLQVEIGSSEIGWECPRRIAYKLAGTPRVNHATDPWRSIIGTGVHMWMAEKFRKLNRFGWRYLVEYPCVYRGIPGHGDLYDQQLGRITDWKTSTVSKIRDMRRRNEVPSYYEIQVQHNAAAMMDRWQVNEACLVFLPIDSTLDNIWVWRTEPDRRVVDGAIDRVERLDHVDPADVPKCPSRMCAYCAQYDPNATDPSRSCDAKKGK